MTGSTESTDSAPSPGRKAIVSPATNTAPALVHREQRNAVAAPVAASGSDEAGHTRVQERADHAGTQFMAEPGAEDVLIRLAAQLERARPWADRHPPLVDALYRDGPG